MLHCSVSLAAAQLLVKLTSALQKSECCSATSAAQHSENFSATSVSACGMLQGWGLEGWGLGLADYSMQRGGANPVAKQPQFRGGGGDTSTVAKCYAVRTRPLKACGVGCCSCCREGLQDLKDCPVGVRKYHFTQHDDRTELALFELFSRRRVNNVRRQALHFVSQGG